MSGFARLIAISVLIADLIAETVSLPPSAWVAGERVGPAPAVRLQYFELDKPEAVKGDVVTARWSFTGRARSMSLVTAAPEGILLGYSWPIAPANSGQLAFTVPISLGTLSPVMFALSIDAKLYGSARLLIRCDYPWFFAPRPERCPSDLIRPTQAAMQMFEGGRMYWLENRRQILVLYDHPISSGQWAYFADEFKEGDAEIDPGLSPPPGKLQPRRGFGLVWRRNPQVRERLGWALTEERGYTACVGSGYGGWKSAVSYLNSPDGQIVEMSTYYMPTAWRVLTGTSFTGCRGI